MILCNINPVAFEIGSLSVRWYGVFITSAILIGYVVACLMAKKRGISFDFMLELFLWAVPIAILFARLSYVLFHPQDFPVRSFADFGNIFAIWNGGISILGAIPGGALGAFIACKRNKIPMAEVLDAVAPGVVLGQALGRWGNWANQELYGKPIANEAWQVFPIAVYIDAEGGWFQATFFYEMVLNLVGFGLILFIFYRSNKNLVTFMSYLTWYMIVRAIMEIFRSDAVSVGGVRIGVLGCAIAAAISLVVTILICVRKIKTGTPRILNEKGEVEQ